MSIQPKGEHIRNSVKWVSEERTYHPETPLVEILEKASVRFNLSPLEVDWLERFIKEKE
ncbi:MAG: hypothetical protein MUD09_07620 [Desulfobacterales bacterium]|nr:hypothetical protein [Desulfobacterales bacterium]